MLRWGHGKSMGPLRNRGTTWKATPIMNRPDQPKTWATPWAWVWVTQVRPTEIFSADRNSMTAPAVKPRDRAITRDDLTKGRYNRWADQGVGGYFFCLRRRETDAINAAPGFPMKFRLPQAIALSSGAVVSLTWGMVLCKRGIRARLSGGMLHDPASFTFPKAPGVVRRGLL